MATPRTKLAQAQVILRTLRLPAQQQNAPAGYTLLALALLGPTDDWAAAEQPCLRVHDMLTFIGKRHHKRYAENSRETIRRRVLHQFEQARIVDRNPDDPTRPTNSGQTCYALTDAALAVVRAFGTDTFPTVVAGFLAAQPGLAETYRREREQSRVEVVLPGGLKLGLSAGRHNELQALACRSSTPASSPTRRFFTSGIRRRRTPSPTWTVLPRPACLTPFTTSCPTSCFTWKCEAG